MSYKSALEAAGAVVQEFQHFGSYQGDWYARVVYKGEEGWVAGSFGSCSHCDAFENEFGYPNHDGSDYDQRLASFGESYLSGILPAEHYTKYINSLNDEFNYDSESEEAARWILWVEDKYNKYMGAVNG